VQADFLLRWQLTGDDPEAWPTVVMETPNLSAGAVQPMTARRCLC
jgi:hypothetical protein